MFPYTEKYTEPESDIQNNIFYKIGQQCQNALDFLEKWKGLETFRNSSKTQYFI